MSGDTGMKKELERGLSKERDGVRELTDGGVQSSE